MSERSESGGTPGADLGRAGGQGGPVARGDHAAPASVRRDHADAPGRDATAPHHGDGDGRSPRDPDGDGVPPRDRDATAPRGRDGDRRAPHDQDGDSTASRDRDDDPVVTRGDHAAVVAPPGADRGADELGATVAALTADDVEPARRRQLLGRLVGQARARGLTDLFKPKSAVRWMVDTVAEIAPHVPVRDLATLRRHFDGLDGEALAERLVRNAARTTAGIGAAGGGVAAVEWTVAPALLSAPVLLAAETVAVVAVELKLIGELHEVYGMPTPTGGTQRAVALMQSWAGQRGINPMMPGVGVGAVLGTAARKELRDTLLKRFGRNLTTLGPFLTGAAVASYLNRRATRMMADQLRSDLRRQSKALPGTPPALPGAR